MGQRELDVQALPGARKRLDIAPMTDPADAMALGTLKTLLERAERIRTHTSATTKKTSSTCCIPARWKASARARPESPRVRPESQPGRHTHQQCLMLGVRTFPDNPYGDYTLVLQLQQTTKRLHDLGARPRQVIVDLGYPGAGSDNLGVEIIHRGKHHRHRPK